VATKSKIPDTLSVHPNLPDYDTTRVSFSWETMRRELETPPSGAGLNIAYEALAHHVTGPRRSQLAIRWLGKIGAICDFTCADLIEQSNRLANNLRRRGVGEGEQVFVLTGCMPALGTLKDCSVLCPLFWAFGPKPIHQCLRKSDARVLVSRRRLIAQPKDIIACANPADDGRLATSATGAQRKEDDQ
jgi:acetyl-CoA synthetase